MDARAVRSGPRSGGVPVAYAGSRLRLAGYPGPHRRAPGRAGRGARPTENDRYRGWVICEVSRRGRMFLPLDVSFFDDDRIIAAGDDGACLYLAMCLRIKQLGSDGRLTPGQMTRLGRPKWRTEIHKLTAVEAVLRDPGTGHYVVAAWFSHNESMDLMISRLAADRERKRKGREP